MTTEELDQLIQKITNKDVIMAQSYIDELNQQEVK
jgi:hypothetical protein